ncbi:MAG: hypothetical protein EXR79_09755 [Myxococcales bacterium]|nr:hypothetical protein [Myxococcales bacterium]
MSLFRFLATPLAVCAMLAAVPASAATPVTAAIQGTLGATAGGPVADGTYSFEFALYDKGFGGTALWSEPAAKLEVKGGTFSHLLGVTKALSAAQLAGIDQAWLGVKVGGDPEMPRTPLHAVLYALAAEHAANLACSGCVKAEHLHADALKAYAKSAELAKVALTGKFEDLAGGPDLSAYAKTTALAPVATSGKFEDLKGGPDLSAYAKAKELSAVAITGKYADLTEPPALAKVGSACGTGLVVKGLAKDGALECVVALDPNALPADGLNEIANNVLTNQFVDSFAAAGVPIDIPDNSPSAAELTIDVPDIGTAQGLAVHVALANSDIGKILVTLKDPAGKVHTLCGGCGTGPGLDTVFPDKTAVAVGDIAAWAGKNPKGAWTLKVEDKAFLDNKSDGQIKAFEVLVKTLSSKKVGVPGGLQFFGGSAPLACGPNETGLMYLDAKEQKLKFCTGKGYATIASWGFGEQGNPAASCKAVLAGDPKAKTGAYWLDVDGDGGYPPFQNWCDMEFDGGGWTLVWKHSYFEVGNPKPEMYFFTQSLQPCADVKAGWCNVPKKTKAGGTEQMTMATYNTAVVYAYKGPLNAALDLSWQGAILTPPTKVVDLCLDGNGNVPEPENDAQAVPGITFDKWTPGSYTSNCDTDWNKYTTDCRWDNCGLPPAVSATKNHVQHTQLIWVR